MLLLLLLRHFVLLMEIGGIVSLLSQFTTAVDGRDFLYAAQAAAAEKLVYHLNKEQSLSDQSAISTNSVAEFSLAGKAGCWKGSAPAFELIILGRTDKWLDAHNIKQPAHLLNLDIYVVINSSGLSRAREETHRPPPEHFGINILILQSKMVASCFYIPFKAVKEVSFPVFLDI